MGNRCILYNNLSDNAICQRFLAEIVNNVQAPNDYFARKYLFTLVPSFTEHDVSCYLFLLRRESWMFKTRCGNKHWKMCHTSNLCRRVRRKKQLHSGKRENRETAG